MGSSVRGRKVSCGLRARSHPDGEGSRAATRRRRRLSHGTPGQYKRIFGRARHRFAGIDNQGLAGAERESIAPRREGLANVERDAMGRPEARPDGHARTKTVPTFVPHHRRDHQQSRNARSAAEMRARGRMGTIWHGSGTANPAMATARASTQKSTAKQSLPVEQPVLTRARAGLVGQIFPPLRPWTPSGRRARGLRPTTALSRAGDMSSGGARRTFARHAAESVKVRRTSGCEVATRIATRLHDSVRRSASAGERNRSHGEARTRTRAHD